MIKNAEHEGRAVGATVADSRSMTALLPIMGVVLVAFLVIGLAVPVLLLHVHQGLGAYTVFLDVALGLGSPALGILAGWKGLGSMFLVSAMVVLGTAGIAATLLPVSDPRTNDKTDRRSS